MTRTGLGARNLFMALALAGCTAAPPPAVRLAGPVPADPVWQTLLRSAERQVRRCYRGPRVSFSGRQIITRLRVSLTPQGAVQGLPTVVEQAGVTPMNQLYAGRMAQAAIQSVLRCAPLRLPEGFASEVPFDIELTFSPLASA